MPRNSKLRFALAGCGRVAPRHLEALAAHAEEAELVAACDPNRDALETLAHRTGAEPFSGLEPMIRATEPDVVVLATPSGLHPFQAMQAARLGCHVVTEKPMATRWSEGKRMVAACAEAGVHLFVVKQHRFNPAVQHLRDAIAARRFGRIYAVNLNLFWTRPQSYYDMAEWRGTWELDGGALMNQAIHYVDLLQWLCGPVESVHASTATLARDIEVEDTAAMTLRWRSGTLGTVCVTMLTYPRNYEGSITIVGERGTARLGGVACDRVLHWEFEDELVDDARIRSMFSGGLGSDVAEDDGPSSPRTDCVYGVGHTPFYRNVIRTLRGEESAVVDGAEGLKSLEIVVAAYRSAQQMQRVSLPLDF